MKPDISVILARLSKFRKIIKRAVLANAMYSDTPF
jgi:hypothetical protein